MYSSDLSCCCAIRLLTGFGNTSAARELVNHTPEEVDQYLKQATSNYQGNMVVLNSDQMLILGDTFKANGFEVIKEFYYHNHGNNIYILMKLHEINNKPKVFLT